MIVNSLDGLATVDFPTAGNYDVRLAENRTMERFTRMASISANLLEQKKGFT